MTTKQNLKDILINLKIPPIQAEVYLKLLETGDSTHTELANQTDIKRTTMYIIVDKMKEQGLIEQLIDTRKLRAVEPKRLFDDLQKNNLAFFHSLPIFQSLTGEPKKLTKVKFYSGLKGIQQLLLDELNNFQKSKEKILRIVGSSLFHIKDDPFREQYQQRRKELGVKTKIIASLDLKEYAERNKSLDIQVKYFPTEIISPSGRLGTTPSRLTLFGLINENNGIIIESRELTDTFIKWFDFTWEKL